MGVEQLQEILSQMAGPERNSRATLQTPRLVRRCRSPRSPSDERRGSWAGIALIFVVGYVLSFVRQRSNSLIPSFIIHTSYNGMLFGVFALSTFVQKGAS